MWKCFGLSEQEVRNALEDAKDRFHKNIKQVANLTPEQCNKALSDAVNTLDQVKKKGHGTLKRDHVLRGEIEDACSKLKELQALKDDKEQVTLKFAEEWRSGLFTNNASKSKIDLNIPDRILPQPSDLESLRSTGNASISSDGSQEIPNQIFQVDSASRYSGMSAHDEEQSAYSSPGSSKSGLSIPCIIQPTDNDDEERSASNTPESSSSDLSTPCIIQPTDNALRSSEDILNVPAWSPGQSDSHERITGVNSFALPRIEYKNYVSRLAIGFNPLRLGRRRFDDEALWNGGS
ncbi:MAG: hypothetical protein J3Q66DRAFT_141344 [Benniella sp.]|nr:MAG: hypothetical protein J3Q66DRAFT_141344 [Benniella sp.]